MKFLKFEELSGGEGYLTEKVVEVSLEKVIDIFAISDRGSTLFYRSDGILSRACFYFYTMIFEKKIMNKKIYLLITMVFFVFLSSGDMFASADNDPYDLTNKGIIPYSSNVQSNDFVFVEDVEINNLDNKESFLSIIKNSQKMIFDNEWTKKNFENDIKDERKLGVLWVLSSTEEKIEHFIKNHLDSSFVHNMSILRSIDRSLRQYMKHHNFQEAKKLLLLCCRKNIHFWTNTLDISKNNEKNVEVSSWQDELKKYKKDIKTDVIQMIELVISRKTIKDLIKNLDDTYDCVFDLFFPRDLYQKCVDFYNSAYLIYAIHNQNFEAKDVIESRKSITSGEMLKMIDNDWFDCVSNLVPIVCKLKNEITKNSKDSLNLDDQLICIDNEISKKENWCKKDTKNIDKKKIKKIKTIKKKADLGDVIASNDQVINLERNQILLDTINELIRDNIKYCISHSGMAGSMGIFGETGSREFDFKDEKINVKFVLNLLDQCSNNKIHLWTGLQPTILGLTDTYKEDQVYASWYDLIIRYKNIVKRNLRYTVKTILFDTTLINLAVNKFCLQNYDELRCYSELSNFYKIAYKLFLLHNEKFEESLSFNEFNKNSCNALSFIDKKLVEIVQELDKFFQNNWNVKSQIVKNITINNNNNANI